MACSLCSDIAQPDHVAAPSSGRTALCWRTVLVLPIALQYAGFHKGIGLDRFRGEMPAKGESLVLLAVRSKHTINQTISGMSGTPADDMTSKAFADRGAHGALRVRLG